MKKVRRDLGGEEEVEWFAIVTATLSNGFQYFLVYIPNQLLVLQSTNQLVIRSYILLLAL